MTYTQSVFFQKDFLTTHIVIRLQYCYDIVKLSQISHSLVVILELSGVSEVQYKEIIIIGDE